MTGMDTKHEHGLSIHCTMHHKLFDRGVFTLSDNLNVMVSESANAQKDFRNG
jgi:predicted restriction endonuclease